MSSSACLMMSKSFGLSPACSSSFAEIDNRELSKKQSEKQGIVAILGSSDAAVSERSRASSLRRTLSADMSSKKWLAENGFSPMKKIASSDELSLAAPSDQDDDNFDGKSEEKPGQFDIWSSIVSHKASDEEAWKSLSSPPYIHPLAKRAASTLSENSLKICTESLGSETGSDGFSSYSASETSSDDVEAILEKEEEEETVGQQSEKQPNSVVSAIEEEYHLHIHRASSTKSLPRSFPPPIPSLSHSDGSSLRMQTRRHNGRLVLEAVPIPCNNTNFHAQRQDGRLVLTFLNASSVSAAAQQKKIGIEEEFDFDEKFVNFLEDEEEDGEIDDEEIEVEKENGMREVEIEMEKAPKLSPRVISFHRLAMMVSNKPIGLANMNQAWPRKINEASKAVKLEEEEEDDDDDDDQHQHHHHHHQKKKQMVPTAAQSLPPRPPRTATSAASAASFNAYEYYWRGNSTATHVALKPLERNTNATVISNRELMANREDDHQKLVVYSLVPFLKGCKKPRNCTPLLFSEPQCIATS